MKLRMKIAAAVVLGLGLTGVAAPAFAASSTCMSADGGTLCAYKVSNGYRATFAKSSNDGSYDFNLQCSNGRWFGSDAPFSVSSGASHSYTFAVGNQGSCSVVLKKSGNAGGPVINSWTTSGVS